MDNHGEMLIYQTEDGLIKIDISFENDTVWLSISQMAELFQRDRSVISKHIKNVFDEGELSPESNVQKLHIADGILTSTGENLLTGNGTVSHLQAMEKAQTEYKKYKAKTLSSVEKDYLQSIKQLEQKEKQKN